MVSHARPDFAAAQGIVFAELGDEAVLLNTETGVYFGLDAVGTRIWKLLVEGASEEQIYASLLDDYDVAPDSLREDLAAFMHQLEQRGLISTAAVRS